jgi:hypothetical protein
MLKACGIDFTEGGIGVITNLNMKL